jgi:hypothetical protein
MEPIQDLSWRAQLSLGTLERFEFNQWSVAAVGPLSPPQSRSHASKHSGKSESPLFKNCRFRLLFFPKDQAEPVYAINMETSILGEWVLVEQQGRKRHVVDHLGPPLHYEDFRIRALERALDFSPEAP